MNERITYS